MFNVFLTLTLFLSLVSAIVIPRATIPPTYDINYLEPYSQYHKRYLALGCQFQHGKKFFDQCCHPMLATETLAKARGPQCVPSPAAAASASAAEPTSTVVPSLGNPDGNCDDNQSSSAPPSSTPAPATPQPVVNPAPDPKPAPTPSTSSSPSPTPTPAKASPAPAKASPAPAQASPAPAPSSSSFFGDGTFFFQNNTPGACGIVHQDTDLVVALDSAIYKDSLCGKQVKITNTANSKSVVATVADECPTCDTSHSVDMSVGTFLQLAAESVGLIKIEWEFV